MTGPEVGLIGIHFIAAALIGIGIHRSALSRGRRAVWAGGLVWLLAEVVQTSLDLTAAAHVPEWVRVGLLAMVISGAVAFALTVGVLGTGRKPRLNLYGRARSAADTSNHPHEEAVS